MVQMFVKLAACLLVTINVLIDRLMTDFPNIAWGEILADLFGAPLLVAQLGFYLFPKLWSAMRPPRHGWESAWCWAAMWYYFSFVMPRRRSSRETVDGETPMVAAMSFFGDFLRFMASMV
jgi:hypothetical protein